MTQMSVGAPFTRVPWNKRGYEPEAVQAFLDRARASYQGGTGELTSAEVRAASFPLARGGFDMRSVDQALARLEDAFAARERDAQIRAGGADLWVDEARSEAQELLARFGRPHGRRFERAGALRSGYSVAEVDAVTDRLARFFSHGDPVSADQLRAAAFHPQRGGYREEQVDAVLDAAVRVILAGR
jgi:DivIVA domain-containing protein